MDRYEWNNDGMVTAYGAFERPPSDSSGEYVLYEEARLIEVDRDIKAANLQLLVEKVLETEAQWCGETARWGEVKPLFDLARSLKQ